jgi:hypothetical protein
MSDTQDTIVVTSNETVKAVEAKGEKSIQETKSSASEKDELASATLEETENENSETESEDEESEAQDENESKDAAQERPKKKGGWQRRVDKLTKEKNFWRDEALRSKESKASEEKTNEPAKEAKTVVSEGKPKQDDFETHEEWIEAVADWKYEQKEQEREAKSKDAEAKNAFQTRVQTFQEECKEFSKVHKDWDDRIEEVSDVLVNPGLMQLIHKSGAAVAYEVMESREEFERLNGLDYTDAAIEIGMIKARLKASNSQKTESTTKTTKAPPPPSPLGRKSDKAVKKTIYDEDISQADFERLYREQTKNKWGA